MILNRPSRRISRPLLRFSLLVCNLMALCSIWSGTACAETDFYRDVYPILKSNCLACHNKTTTDGSLNLESPETIARGGDSGPSMISGNARESLIYEAATQLGDFVMPPKNNKSGAVRLTEDELKILAAWINEGAKKSVQQMERVVWQPISETVRPIYSVAMTGDGRWVVGGRSNQLDLYDLALIRYQGRISDPDCIPQNPSEKNDIAHRSLIQSVTFSPDGKRLASGTDSEVKIWKNELSNLPKVTPSPVSGCIASSISSNGQQQAFLDAQGTLKILSTNNGALVKTLQPAHAAPGAILRFSPDGKFIAVPTSDEKLSVWNLTTGEKQFSVPVTFVTKFLEWTPGSAAVIAAGDVSGIHVWQWPNSPEQTLNPPFIFSVGQPELKCLQVSGNEHIVTIKEDGEGRVWKWNERRVVHVFPSPESTTMATADSLIAIVSPEGVIRVSNIQSGKVIMELTGNVTSRKQLATLNLDVERRQLEESFQQSEIARMERQNEDLEAILKKAQETIERATKALPEQEEAVQSADKAVAEANKLLEDVDVRIREAESQQPIDAASLARLKEEKDRHAKTLASAGLKQKDAVNKRRESQNQLKDSNAGVQRGQDLTEKNSAAIIRVKEQTAAAKLETEKARTELEAFKSSLTSGNPKPVSLCLTSDGNFLAAGYSSGEIRVWAVPTGTPVGEGSVDTLASAGLAKGSVRIDSPANGVFVICREDGTRVTFDINPQWKLEHVLGGESSSFPLLDRVTALDFSPDGKQLAVASGTPSRSGEISLWGVESGEMVSNWKGHHADNVLSISFSADGRQLASGGADKLARVTDVATGKPSLVLEGHTHHVLGLSYRSDSRTLATAGGDGSVLIWDLQTGERLRKIEGWSKEVTALQFLGATSQLVASSGDQKVRFVKDDGAQVRVIENLPEFMHSIVSSNSGTVCAAGGQDGVLRIWDTSSGKELAVFPAP
ncbi:MAG TPA: c-type cytochrome domain-containing protein [Planctomicrobium sp.]|nr:c-type cytochrome domain-containing protein [Planctomicrobium sp.]